MSLITSILLTFPAHTDRNLTQDMIPHFSPQRTPGTFYLPGKCQSPAQNVRCWSYFKGVFLYASTKGISESVLQSVFFNQSTPSSESIY